MPAPPFPPNPNGPPRPGLGVQTMCATADTDSSNVPCGNACDCGCDCSDGGGDGGDGNGGGGMLRTGAVLMGGSGGTSGNSATGRTAAPESISYDHEGNRTNAGYTTPTNDNNRLQSDGTYSYVYDGNGNVISRTNIATGAVDTYTWDDRNRLTSVVSKTAAGVMTSQEQYTYHAFDQRISQSIDANGDGVFETVERYDYVNGQLALVFNSSGQVQERYLYGPGTNQVLAVEMGNGGAVRWFLTDNLGTVRDVTDSIGNVLDHLVVDPFGVVTSQSNAAYAPRFIYAGMEFDQATGLYLDGERYYNPGIGRFMSQDPAGFAGGGTNLYSYVDNDAPNMVDPSGLSPTTPNQPAPSEDDESFVPDADQPYQGGGYVPSWTTSWYTPPVYNPPLTDEQISALIAEFFRLNPDIGGVAYVTAGSGNFEDAMYSIVHIPATGGEEGSAFWTRASGGLRAVLGITQAFGGAALAAGSSPTVVGAVVGGITALKGIDNFQAGFSQLLTGKQTQTGTFQFVAGLTGSQRLGTAADFGSDFLLPGYQGVSALRALRGAPSGGMNMIPGLHSVPTAPAGPGVEELFQSVSRDPRFLKIAGVTEAEMNSALNSASIRTSNIFQGGYAGRVPLPEGGDELVLALSPLHAREVPAAHELFHLARDLQGIQTLSIGETPGLLGRMSEEAAVWASTFRYAPVGTTLEVGAPLVVTVAGAAGVYAGADYILNQ